MKIVFDYSIFFHQKYGGVSRYFINLHDQLLGMNSKAKIFAPIHTNLHLKNSNHIGNFKFYMKKYPVFTRRILKSSYHTFSSVFGNKRKHKKTTITLLIRGAAGRNKGSWNTEICSATDF